MQQALNINIQVEMMPSGTFYYRITEAAKDVPKDRQQIAKEMALPPYYLPSGTGDLHGPVVIRSVAV